MRVLIYCPTGDKIQDGGYFIYDISKVFSRHIYKFQSMPVDAFESQTWVPYYDNFHCVIV